MARRRYARRAASYAGRRARSIGGGIRRKTNTRALMAGGIAGAATPFVSKYAPKWGPAISLGATGIMMGNETLQTLAGYVAGQMLSSNIPGGVAGPAGGYL